MKKLNYDKEMRRINAAKGNKQLWEDKYRQLYRYFMPDRNTIDDYSPGQQKDEYVFDSTAVDSLEDYASRMESQLVPPGREWMILESGTDIPENKHQEINEKLEIMTNTLFSHINSSNFSSQIHEAFLDLGISTGAIIVEEGDGIQSSLRFRCVSLSELVLERSARGIVETAWRTITIQAADIPAIFPRITMSDNMKRDIVENPETDYEFIEGVSLNEDQSSYTSMVLHPQEKAVVYEEQQESSPWIIFRESTIPGETYGRGRAFRCLNDVKTLNRIRENYLRGLALIGNPIYTATDDGIINPYTIRLEPNAIIPVGSNERNNPTLAPLQPAGIPDLNQAEMAYLRDNVRRTMLSKPFGQIDETPVRTATEMSIRNADMAQTSIGASGRIQAELLERLVARCVYILRKAGKLPEMRVDGKEVAIKFTSPAARAQDEAELATTMRFMEMMTAMPPEIVQQTIKLDKVPKHIADIVGLSSSLLKSDLEIQEEQAEQKQQQQAMQAAAMAQQGGQAQ